ANLSCVAQTGLESMLPIGTPRKPFSANCWILHIESDVVERPPLGCDGRPVGFHKVQTRSWYFGGPILIVRQRLCTKNLRVPSLDFGYRGFCHRELDITVLDRNLLVLVFHNFDAQAIRYGHERLIGSAIDARLHLHARSFQPSCGLLQTLNGDPDLVYYRAII